MILRTLVRKYVKAVFDRNLAMSEGTEKLIKTTSKLLKQLTLDFEANKKKNNFNHNLHSNIIKKAKRYEQMGVNGVAEIAEESIRHLKNLGLNKKKLNDLQDDISNKLFRLADALSDLKFEGSANPAPSKDNAFWLKAHAKEIDHATAMIRSQMNKLREHTNNANKGLKIINKKIDQFIKESLQ